MSIPTNPDLLAMPFAKDGDKNSIPETTSPTTGLFSQQYGFQNINSLPLTAGGKAISRLDYNGAMYMLSNLLFYLQRGYTFVYDNTMDYLVGCQVLDPNDGQVYICTADAVAGTGVPSATPANWEMVPNAANLDLKVNPTFDNVVIHKETFTTSGTFEAPVTGTYKITLQGGGGGGAGATSTTYGNRGGGGGGGGAMVITYEKLIAGTSYSFVVGAGGTGGAGGTKGNDGGDTTLVVNNNSYNAGGGLGGNSNNEASAGGFSGDGKINDVVVSKGIAGANGGTTSASGTALALGGAGGGLATRASRPTGTYDGLFGSGGTGGAFNSTPLAGGAGGDGYITFEWLDTSLL